MTEGMKSYEVKVRILPPGYVKPIDPVIIIPEAKDMEDAITRAETIWLLAVQMKDVSIRELPNDDKTD